MLLSCSSLSSKVVSQYSSVFAPMAVEAVMKILDVKNPKMLDLRDIKVVTKLGGTIDDSELVEGMVFAQKAAKSAGGPKRVEKAKIGLIQVLPTFEYWEHAGCQPMMCAVSISMQFSRL